LRSEKGICFFIKENVNLCYTYRRIILHSNYQNYTTYIHPESGYYEGRAGICGGYVYEMDGA